MTTAEPPAEKLQADVVMATAFGVLKQHWLVLVGLALVLSIPQFLAPFLFSAYLPSNSVLSDALLNHPRIGVLLLRVTVTPFAGIAVGVLVGYASWLILGERAAHSVRARDVTRNMRVMLVVAVAGLAVGVGLSLLLVPGVLIMAAIAPALGAAAVEGRGVADSLRRGYQLTKGSRRTIIGLAGLVMLFITAIQFLGSFAAQKLYRPDAAYLIFNSAPEQWFLGVAGHVVPLLFQALVFAALYAELIRIKDGYDPAIEVFA